MLNSLIRERLYVFEREWVWYTIEEKESESMYNERAKNYYARSFHHNDSLERTYAIPQFECHTIWCALLGQNCSSGYSIITHSNQSNETAVIAFFPETFHCISHGSMAYDCCLFLPPIWLFLSLFLSLCLAPHNHVYLYRSYLACHPIRLSLYCTTLSTIWLAMYTLYSFAIGNECCLSKQKFNQFNGFSSLGAVCQSCKHRKDTLRTEKIGKGEEWVEGNKERHKMRGRA